jgi:hypothetical protein
MASVLAHPVTILAAVLGVLLAAVVPTCLYFYVEPRGRLSWGVAGDSPRTRRAPALVRITACVSFAAGQLAIPWLLVPAACAGLLYAQAKLGAARPLGAAATVLLGVMGFLQAIFALGLIPVGVRLLTRDERSWSRMRGLAKVSGLTSGLLLATSALIGWGMAADPGLVHPWLRVALVWTALRPVMGYAAVGVAHALLVDWCARVHVRSARGSQAPPASGPAQPSASGPARPPARPR